MSLLFLSYKLQIKCYPLFFFVNCSCFLVSDSGHVSDAEMEDEREVPTGSKTDSKQSRTSSQSLEGRVTVDN